MVTKKKKKTARKVKHPQQVAAAKSPRVAKGTGSRLPPIRVDLAEREAVEKTAKRSRLSVADWMRTAIRERLAKDERTKKRQAGRGKTGKRLPRLSEAKAEACAEMQMNEVHPAKKCAPGCVFTPTRAAKWKNTGLDQAIAAYDQAGKKKRQPKRKRKGNGHAPGTWEPTPTELHAPGESGLQ